ncbi:uncharacterized protein [Procambarus clarkii]|uniref:uncharacterized protein n=1 Tax=Procambarus clarkii TaxID=6728 RepID=UPI003742EA3A
MVHTICEWISQTLGGFSSDLQEMKVGFSRDLHEMKVGFSSDLQEMKVGFSRDLQEMQALIHSQKSELEEAKEKIKRLREKSEFKPVQGSTALHIAAVLGHDNTVKVLLDAGADINASDNNNSHPDTLMHTAAAVDDGQRGR